MAEKLQFELVSPEKLLLSQPVAMVVVPGSEGNFGALPGHSLLISTVRPGVIDVYADEQTKISQSIFVSGGFAEVTPERCTVLAEEAMDPATLDRAAAEAELQVVEGNLPSLRDQVGRATGADRDRLAAELRGLEHQQAVARAKLQAIAAESAH